MIILLDCDGVLSDFVSETLAIGNRLVHGDKFTHADLDGVGWEYFEPVFGPLSSAVKKEISNSTPFAQQMAVLPGAIEAVKRLRELGEVYVVTSPWSSNRTWTHEREAWLKRHFDIPSSHVIHTAAKHLVRGDVLIDDKTATLGPWEEANPGSLAIRWNSNYTRNEPWDGAAVDTWDELIAELECEAAFCEAVETERHRGPEMVRWE